MPYQHQRVEPVEASEPTLLDYLGWLRRRWWILVVGALVGLVAAGGFTMIQPKTYQSSASVLVRSIGVDAASVAKVNLDTEAQVVRSIVVATRVKDLLKESESPEDLRSRVTVTVPPNAQVLDITFEGATPSAARDGAHAFAQAYLDLSVELARKEVDKETEALRTQIDEVNKQLTAVAGKIAQLPANSVDRQRAEADRNVLTAQLANLNSRLSPLLSAALDPGSIISDSRLPTRPASPNQLLNLATGAAGGLLLGIALALLLERFDTRIRRGRQVSERLGLPLLLELTGTITSVSLLPANDRLAREFGRLRNVLLTTVQPRRSKSRGRRLLICAATPGDATGFVVGNLAAAYARTGSQVVVVTTNPASPLARLAGAGAKSGLADVLRRDVSVLQALTAVPNVAQLRLLLPGDLDSYPELPVGGLIEVLDELSERFEHVLIETPPTAHSVEAQALASHVDAVILSIELRATHMNDITVALDQFEQVEAEVIGSVVVPTMPGSHPVNGAGHPVQRGPMTAVRQPSTPSQGRGPVADSTVVLPRMSRPSDGTSATPHGTASTAPRPGTTPPPRPGTATPPRPGTSVQPRAGVAAIPPSPPPPTRASVAIPPRPQGVSDVQHGGTTAAGQESDAGSQNILRREDWGTVRRGAVYRLGSGNGTGQAGLSSGTGQGQETG